MRENKQFEGLVVERAKAEEEIKEFKIKLNECVEELLCCAKNV